MGASERQDERPGFVETLFSIVPPLYSGCKYVLRLAEASLALEVGPSLTLPELVEPPPPTNNPFQWRTTIYISRWTGYAL